MINKLHEVPTFSLFNNYEIIRKLKYKINEIIDVINTPAPVPSSSLPEVTAEDNGDVLTVINGEWDKAELPSSEHIYSTTEQVVGTWTDGKPLYEKVIDLTDQNINYINSGINEWVDNSFLRDTFMSLNAERIIKFVFEGNNGQAPIPCVQFYISDNTTYFKWYITNYGNLNGNVIQYAIAQYTKTTD